jgi:hypothetical protein
MGSISNIFNVGSGITKSVGAYTASTAAKYAGDIQASVDRTDATIAENQANDAITRGNQAAIRNRMGTQNLRSKQTAMFAANGVDLTDGGTAASVLHDTELMGSFDESTIIANAQREAFGYKTQAQNYRSSAALMQARADSENPFVSGASTLLTSAGQVAPVWYRKGK